LASKFKNLFKSKNHQGGEEEKKQQAASARQKRPKTASVTQMAKPSKQAEQASTKLRKGQSLSSRDLPQQALHGGEPHQNMQFNSSQKKQTPNTSLTRDTSPLMHSSTGRSSRDTEHQSRSRQFSKRTFFLPDEQEDHEGEASRQSDSVSITLNHTCANPACPHPHLKSEQLMQSAKETSCEDPDTKLYKRILVWECPACHHAIQPTIQARVGASRERVVEEVPLYHSVQLRNLVEIYLQVDINYRSVQQRDLDQLRQNRNLFWNLIYYFSATNIPLEFLVPYQDSSLYKVLPYMLDLESKQDLLECTRRYGLRYLDVYVTMHSKNYQREQLSGLDSYL